jgi:2-polyprenyl-3-methyl-5-hydroxy-6-metoxy-1,4-benzoquinol methylase
MTNMLCRLCGNDVGNTVIPMTEMMLGSGDRFEYLHCYQCGSLGLILPPADMPKYYPSGYYSFVKAAYSPNSSGLKSAIRHSSMRAHLGKGDVIDTMVGGVKKIHYGWLYKGLIDFDSKILDVGCGNGFLLKEMSNYGFTNLTGIDAYIEQELSADIANTNLLKMNIDSLEENNFELIMYHHSFEHIQDPLRELNTVFNKIKQGGTVLIRTPVANSFAFRKYRQYWVQLDAPRHYYLYTVAAITKLCERAGFILKKVVYDSTSFQFTGSECYLRGLPLKDSGALFNNKEIRQFDEESKRLNAMQDGDSACFYLAPIK